MAHSLRRAAILGFLAGLSWVTIAITPPLVAEAAADACHRYGPSQPKTIDNADARRAVVCLINKKRRSHGRPALSTNSRLTDAAQNHSEYMESHHCFSHQCSGERSLSSRLSVVGYLTGGLLSWLYGENIAWGERRLATPRSIVNAWMNSAGHRAIILNGSYRDVGVGVVWGTPSNPKARGGIYTADFGYRAW
jgi:uncharacterized protein YkwD